MVVSSEAVTNILADSDTRAQVIGPACGDSIMPASFSAEKMRTLLSGCPHVIAFVYAAGIRTSFFPEVTTFYIKLKYSFVKQSKSPFQKKF